MFIVGCICKAYINKKKSIFINPQPLSPNSYTGEYTGEKPSYSNDPQYNSGNYNSNYPQQQLQDIGPIINN